MTDTGYFAPPPAPAAVSVRPVWRTVVTVFAAVFGPPAALVSAFLALVTWAGCFLDCHDQRGDHLTGGLLALLAVGLLVSGPACALTLMRSGRAVLLTLLPPVLFAGYLAVGAWR